MMAAEDGAIRVSDADRERTVEQLRAHASEGRLDLAELESRVAAALAATSRGDLAKILEDLPAPGGRRRDRSDLREHVTVFAAVQLLFVAIWALTGAGYFWPVWPFLGWGIGVVLHAVAPAESCSSRRYHSSSMVAQKEG